MRSNSFSIFTFKLTFGLLFLSALLLNSCTFYQNEALCLNLKSIEITDIDSQSQSVLAAFNYVNNSNNDLNISELNTEFFANGLKIGQKKCTFSKTLSSGQSMVIPISIVFNWDDIIYDKNKITELEFSLFNATSYSVNQSSNVTVINFKSKPMSFTGF